jgi:hypothetical protein
MNVKGILPYILLCFLAILTFYKHSQQSKQILALEKTIEKNNIPTPEAREFELATEMGKLQYFSNKLYFSLKGKNQPLVNFYIHEMEESFEAIEEANVIEDGVSISDNIKAYGLKGIKNFERFIEQSPEQFEEHYQNLINACNSCHLVSKHGFIKITVPTTPIVSNQNFEQ